MAYTASLSQWSSFDNPRCVKLPRDVSGSEVCRALERLGFQFVRQTGSHRHYAKSGLHPCVPMHREVKPKTLQSILRQANITVEELLNNLWFG
jgi:predicted RNA binding protein YcfA (HicA-like mRNA interferase family)